jgi:hypothetical protein
MGREVGFWDYRVSMFGFLEILLVTHKEGDDIYQHLDAVGKSEVFVPFFSSFFFPHSFHPGTET